MPYVDPTQMPPQRGPKSPRAVQAESNQAKAALDELEVAKRSPKMQGSVPSRASIGKRNPFMKKISVFDWKVSPEDMAEKLHG